MLLVEAEGITWKEDGILLITKGRIPNFQASFAERHDSISQKIYCQDLSLSLYF